MGRPQGLKILVNGDGDSFKGLGHLVRILGSALEMPEPFEPIFATSQPAIAERIHGQLSSWLPGNVRIVAIPGVAPNAPASDWPETSSAVARGLEELLRSEGAQALISDGKYPWTAAEMARLTAIAPVLLVDNPTGSGAFATRLIFPTDHYYPALSQGVDSSKVRHGIEWTWLHPGAKAVVKAGRPQPEYDLTISMGGSDPWKLTLRAMEKIAASEEIERVGVIVGDAFKHKDEIRALASRLPRIHWDLIEGASRSHQVLSRSSAVLCAFGITLYECYAMGVPGLVVSHDPGNAQDSEIFLRNHPSAGRTLRFDLPDSEFVEAIELVMAWPRPSAPKTLGGLAQRLGQEVQDLVP